MIYNIKIYFKKSKNFIYLFEYVEFEFRNNNDTFYDVFILKN